jgi:hypothetical protein
MIKARDATAFFETPTKPFSPTQLAIKEAILDGHTRVYQIAKALNFTAPSIHQQVKALMRMGVLERRPGWDLMVTDRWKVVEAEAARKLPYLRNSGRQRSDAGKPQKQSACPTCGQSLPHGDFPTSAI